MTPPPSFYGGAAPDYTVYTTHSRVCERTHKEHKRTDGQRIEAIFQLEVFDYCNLPVGNVFP